MVCVSLQEILLRAQIYRVFTIESLVGPGVLHSDIAARESGEGSDITPHRPEEVNMGFFSDSFVWAVRETTGHGHGLLGLWFFLQR